ncbi:MAG: hypothetical protein ACFFDB_11990 [Promethearchaeota archaeon]
MKKSIKIIIILLIPVIIFGGSIGSFYIIGFMNYGVIQESYSFYYNPAIRADPEKIRINTFGATINIKYNQSSVPYYIKADIDFKAEGMYMKGGSPAYYFTAYWNNNSLDSMPELFVTGMPPTLGPFYHPTWTVRYDIHINITLRTDILYDLHFDVWDTDIIISENLFINNLFIEAFSRNVGLNANGTNINNIEATAYSGYLTMNLDSCNISDGINATSTKGDINFLSYNIKCDKEVDWILRTETGSINAIIFQDEVMGANIFGDFFASMGHINIEYEDVLSAVGAIFNAMEFTGSFITTNLGGFDLVGSSLFRSIDYYSANNSFTFTLRNHNGNIQVVGKSS